MNLNHTIRRVSRSLILFVVTLSLVLVCQSLPSMARSANLVSHNRNSIINVRSGPSVFARSLYRAQAGDRIQILTRVRGGDGYTWYRVKSERSSIRGWVRGDLVSASTRMPPRRPRSLFSSRSRPMRPQQGAGCATTYPVRNPQISSGFGRRTDPLRPGRTQRHTGIDLNGDTGDPVYSPTCGVITSVNRSDDSGDQESGYGRFIKVTDRQGRIHFFAHLSQTEVEVGDRVSSGQRIAAIGSTGRASGPHLHYEVREGVDSRDYAVNPMEFLTQAQARR